MTETTPSASPSPPATTAAPKKALKIAYAIEGALWLYDTTTNQRRPLAAERGGEIHAVRFIDEERISFVADGAIREEQLSSGRRRDVAAIRGSVLAYGWSPERTTVAYLSVDFDRREPHSVFLYTVASRNTRLVKRFSEHLGRGSPDGEEIAIRWSKDGTRLLVVDTPLDTTASGPKPTMYVVRGTGANVIAPRDGTQALWSSDDARIYYREWGPDSRWFSVELRGGGTTPLGMRSSTLRPALSPNGRMLAYDDGRERPSVFVYDLTAGSERRIGTGVAPLWLDDGALIVTNTKPCAEVPDGCGVGPPWVQGGSTSRLSLSGGAPARLTMHTTLRADVLYG